MPENLALRILDLAQSVSCEVVDVRPTEETTTYSLLPRAEVHRRNRASGKQTAILALVTVGVLLGALLMAAAGQHRVRVTAERFQPAPEVVRSARALTEKARVALRIESALESDRDSNQRLVGLLWTVVHALDERDELTVIDLTSEAVRELGLLSPNPEHVLASLGRVPNTRQLTAADGPTLVRRGSEVWTHLLLRSKESPR